MKIAIVDKSPSKVDYGAYFNFDYDLYHLCSTEVSKVYKKDIDIEIDESEYTYIITVGADATKNVAKKASVISHQGCLIDDKYIPLSNPNMLAIKPQAAPAFYKAIESIHKYISGEIAEEAKFDVRGIQDTVEALEYVTYLIDDPSIEEIGVDTETSDLDPRAGYLLGICISHAPYQGVYIDANCITEELEKLLQLLFDLKTCIFHNAKFDIKWLNYHFKFTFPKYHDTMLEHYTLDETKGSHGLKDLAIKYTDYGPYDQELEDYKDWYCKTYKVKKSEFTYDLIPFDVMTPYAAKDPSATLMLHKKFYPIIEKNKNISNVYHNILLKGNNFLMKVEENGIPMSVDKLHQAEAAFDKLELQLLDKLYRVENGTLHDWEESRGKEFNPASTVQLRDFLFNWLKLEPTGIKTDKGEHSTNAESLKILAEVSSVAEVIHKLRQVTKLKNTYIKKFLIGLDKDNRIRTSFNLTTTTSGRLSSSGKFNAQTMPRDNKIVKACITARPGYKIVSLDLKTAEMYIASVLSGDKNLQKVFTTGVDYHGFMAVHKYNLKCDPNEVAELYPDLRQSAKTVSFEILYKLNMREEVLDNFPRLKRWLMEQVEIIKANASIYSIFGRKRRLPNVNSSSREIAQHEIRSGINFLVQSTASDVNLLAGIEMQEYLDENPEMDAKIFMLVHDSIVAEVKEDQVDEYVEILTQFIQKDRGVSIPGCPIGVDVEVGNDYSFVEGN